MITPEQLVKDREYAESLSTEAATYMKVDESLIRCLLLGLLDEIERLKGELKLLWDNDVHPPSDTNFPPFYGDEE